MSEVSIVSQAEQGRVQSEVEQKPFAPKKITEKHDEVPVQTEEKISPTADIAVKSADSIFQRHLKKSTEIASHVLRLSAQRLKSSRREMALAASAIPILAACNFGSAEKQNTPPPPESTPAVSQVEKMPSAEIEFTRTPPPTDAPVTPTPSPTQEAPSESPQPSEQQEKKELVSYAPSITILDAAPSVSTEGIIQKEFISNDEMIRNCLGDKYVSKEQLIQEFGQNYEEKWDEVVEKYPQALMYRFADTYFNHGENVADVVEGTFKRSGLRSTGINILPLQKIFDKDSCGFIEDPSGNPGISLNFDPKRIIEVLKDDSSRVVSGSFQVGNVELYQKTDSRTEVIPKYERGKFEGFEHPTEDKFYIGAVRIEFHPDGSFVFPDAQGNKIEPVTMEELERMKLEESEVKEIKSTSLSIVGAYTKEKAMENLPKLFEVCNAYPDKFFVFAGGNTGEDFREAMEALKDQRPKNLLIAAEWLKGNYGGFDYEGPAMVYGKYGPILGPDIYVNNEELGQPHGSSFSTPVISSEVDMLLKKGFSFEQAKEAILAKSDLDTLGLNDGTSPTVRVFNPQLLENK